MSTDSRPVVVPLAPGFEEIETVAIVDVLRRAEIAVVTASVDGNREVEGSHGIALIADTTLDSIDADGVRAVVLPGGMPGAQHLHDDDRVQSLVRSVAVAGGITAAICAAPWALSRTGVTAERRATSYPTFRDRVACREYERDAVVVDGPVITSRGPGTALQFAAALVAALKGPGTAADLREAMLF